MPRYFMSLCLGLLMSCSPGRNDHNILSSKAEREQHQKSDLDSCLSQLELAFQSEDLIQANLPDNACFSALVGDSAYRVKLRDLCKKHPSMESSNMTSADEEGELIRIVGNLKNEDDSSAISGALVELVQADKRGLYFDEKGTFNPRIFRYLVTDSSGTFEIQTIRPGKYYDDAGHLVESHIHFGIERSGFRSYFSEFVLLDDNDQNDFINEEHVPIANRIQSSGDELPLYRVRIYLQPH